MILIYKCLQIYFFKNLTPVNYFVEKIAPEKS